MTDDELERLLRALPPAPADWVDAAVAIPDLAGAAEAAPDADVVDEHDDAGADSGWIDDPPDSPDAVADPLDDDATDPPEPGGDPY